MRYPAVAGTFYPGTREALEHELRELFGARPEELLPGEQALPGPLGLVLPHAGYMYSGAVAAAGCRAAARYGRPTVVLIFGTNHTGYGGPITVGTPEPWATPLGEVPVAEDLLREMEGLPGVVRDPRAFAREHSVEVQLPFIQYLFGPVPFVPVVVLTHDVATIGEFGAGIAEIVRGRGVWLIASTDFTHYEPQDIAVEKDKAALNRILDLDLEGFLHVVEERRISICGAGAIGIVMAAARSLGLDDTELVAYRTSGEVSGYTAEVVGYAAVLFRRKG
ncbi:MAG: AmmeMemoRadiSam system protein B [Caldiserica bacterium]|nr:AmmeMemoRadiSam system protein B [Caldisericota bacterium]